MQSSRFCAKTLVTSHGRRETAFFRRDYSREVPATSRQENNRTDGRIGVGSWPTAPRAFSRCQLGMENLDSPRKRPLGGFELGPRLLETVKFCQTDFVGAVYGRGSIHEE